ncbi:MAG: hypothetical protein U0640_12200 [Phycisphaerales bacterium]
MHWLRHLDQLLRGKHTTEEQAMRGISLPLAINLPLVFVLGGVYGACMGCYALIRLWGNPKAQDGFMQTIASIVKIPALFILTLIVTFPSLYVFNALVGARLTFKATIELLVAAIVVSLAVAASLGPILVFFTLSTDSYPFMVVLNVILLAIAGIIGLGFLLGSLRKIANAAAMTGQAESTSGDAIFKVWVLIYGLVGLQMGWILRPFIGHPSAAFEWFRPRTGSFFTGFFESLSRLVGM